MGIDFTAPANDEGRAELRRVVAAAMRAEVALRAPLGPRELLLGLACRQPELVANTARQQGLDPDRLFRALSEWLPATKSVVPEGKTWAAPSRSAIHVLQRTKELAQEKDIRPLEALAQILFKPNALDSPVDEPHEGTQESVSDRTHAIVRALCLT